MNLTPPLAALLTLLFGLLLTAGARADYPLEIIDLTSRPAEDVIPLVAPLAGPDGVVTGTGGTLFIRAAPQRVAEIRRALQALDSPPRNLLIQVRLGLVSDGAGTRIGASVDEELSNGVRVRVGPRTPGGGSRIAAGSSNGSGARDVAQEVRVLDGHRAFIAIGSERPIVYREGYVGPDGAYHRSGTSYERTDSGFYVLPRVVRDRVTLEISAFDSGPPNRRRTAEVGGVQTMVSGRLGEWIPLGGSTQDERRQDQGLLTYRDGERQAQRDIYLRVLELP